MAEVWSRKKSLLAIQRSHATGKTPLKRVLGLGSLTAIGVGCTIGTGIFVFTGEVAVKYAGPAVTISFLLAALACAFAALCYSELAMLIPASGSTYSYAYVAMGELTAFLIGWCLMLEYGLANSAVAAGWGGYLDRLFTSIGYPIPKQFLYAPGALIPDTIPQAFGLFNAPAAVCILIVTALLCMGIKESANFNSGIVVAKILVILMFLFLCAPAFNPANMTPYMPFGWQGVATGAAQLFFLFIGFDAITTVAEEAIDPQRDLPRAVLAALAIVTVLYVAVGIVLTGVMSLDQLKGALEPLAAGLALTGHPWAAWVLSAVVVVGILGIAVVGTIGQTRIFYVMSRDGLMPRFMGNINEKTGTPMITTLFLGIVTAFLAATIPLDTLADMVSAGTLAAFSIVCAAVIQLRRSHPDTPRSFSCPWVPGLPLCGIAINLYLMTSLNPFALKVFVFWIFSGFVLYVLWGQGSASKVYQPDEALLPPLVR